MGGGVALGGGGVALGGGGTLDSHDINFGWGKH